MRGGRGTNRDYTPPGNFQMDADAHLYPPQMRVMLLTPEAPAPRHVNGGATRQYKLFKRLIDLGHDVTIVSVFPATDDPYIDDLRDEGFRVEAVQRPASRLKEVASAVLRKPALLTDVFRLTFNEMIGAVYWVDLKSIALRELATGDYDLVCIEVESASRWLGDLPRDLPIVLTNHEVESPQHEENSRRLSGFSGWLRRVNARRARSSERRWSPHFDAIITMSDNETKLLREIVGELPPTWAIGNGADISELAAVGPDRGSGAVLFTGTMSFPPNAAAAEWLAREVWPAVLEAKSDAKLLIVGRNPSQSTKNLGELPSIEIHQNVPSMVPFFERADVCTLPMVEGGGTRLKLAEAMAAGRPVVATTNGATGVDVVPGKEVLIADQPKEFADAIVRLLGDPQLRASMGANARALAMAKYDWNSLGDEMLEVFQRVIDDFRA